MAKLLVHESAGLREFELIDNEIHLGRELDNTLRLPDPSISRHHCVIRKQGGSYEIQDLQSSNGVLVNGNRVQASPLRDGDRITLGQVQLTFQDPRSEVHPTVAISAQEAPAVPSGTVRMSADQLAAIHSGKAIPEPEPRIQIADPVATGPVPTPTTPPPAPPIPPVAPKTAPEFGHFTDSGTQANPLPAFFQPYLPPLPDDAQPTGERGDFLTRLFAGLIDYSPILVLQILSALLVPTTLATGGLGGGLGALAALGCFSIILFLGYLILVPWCWMKFGATPGKKVMKLRVVPESNPTGRLDLGMAVLRMLGYFVNAVISWIITLPFAAIFVVGAVASGGLGANVLMMKLIGLAMNVVPYLLILFTAGRKGLHDMMSKTVVIKVDR